MSNKKSLIDSDIQYHIGMKEGDVADFVILPGDPGRVDFIAQHLMKLEKLLTTESIKQ